MDMSNSQAAVELDSLSTEKKPSDWYSLLLFFFLALILTMLVTHTAARVEDKYFQTHRVFLDPAVYQEHVFKLWQASHDHSRFELAWNEFANPPEEDIPPLAFRTIPLLLLNPDWLKDPHAHLITSGFSLFIFLLLLLHTVYRRTNNLGYAPAVAVMVCAIPCIYDPFYGLGAFWLDFSAGFMGASAALCVINYGRKPKLVWLAGFAVLAACSLMSRFVSGAYLFVQTAPLLAFFLLRRWKQTKSFLNAVLTPSCLVGGILVALTGWYIWRHAPAQSFYYNQESYDSLSLLTSAHFVLDSTKNFLGYNLSLISLIVFGCQILLGFRVAWRGLLSSAWMVLGAALVLVLACQIAYAAYAMEYLLPALLFTLLCPIDWGGGPRLFRHRIFNLFGKVITPLALLITAAVSLDQTLQNTLWKPPLPTPEVAARKALDEGLINLIMEHYPDKVVGAYFDQFDEYAFVTAFERYGRPPHLLSGRVFDVRAEYLKADFPNKSIDELVEMAWREADEKCDIALVFNEPSTAFKATPFDYGSLLNPYSEAIASELAKRVSVDPNWKKLFVVPSKFLPGGVAGYANLKRFPDAAALGDAQDSVEKFVLFDSEATWKIERP
jgi:hypothetical protein